MPRQSGLRLSVGAGTARKIVATGCGVSAFFVAGMLLWVLFRLMYETLAARPIEVWGALVPHLVAAGVFLLGAYVTIAFGTIMLGMIRFSGFLDGTRLAVRYVFSKRWVDLATADIDASYDPARGGVQLLVARSPDGQREVKLPVSQGSQTIPAAELTALADAITSRRMRAGPDDRAFVVAEQLRRLATRPSDMPSSVLPSPSKISQAARNGEQPQPAPLPAELPVTAHDPHRTRNTALAVAIVLVPLLGGCVVIGFVVGRGLLAVAIACLLILSTVVELRRQLKKHQGVQ